MSDHQLTPEEMLAMASAFDLIPFDRTRVGVRMVRIELRIGRDRNSWAICSEGATLAKDGEWETEPMNSNKSDAYLERCRWQTAEAALTFARAHMARYPSGYKTLS